MADTNINSTEEHPFYVVSKGWVFAKDLKVGDKLKLADGNIKEVEAVCTEKLEEPVMEKKLNM